MGTPKQHPKVKIICGFIFLDNDVLPAAKKMLSDRLSPVDFESEILDFKYTDYYQKEMGADLKRQFISFRDLAAPGQLPVIKLFANSIENKLAQGGKRRINIDPGYLDMAKLVLASTKDYFHRIHLDKGIFAEVTLYYRGRSFKPWEWTYPDYQSGEYIDIFNRVRDNYAQEITD